MEFRFDVNEILPDEITVVDSRLHPFKPNHLKEKGAETMKKNLEELIDKMGNSSSRAQNLKMTITTYGKLAANDHRLYLLKDSAANSGKGAVVGLIKVGKKRLFVVDYHSQQLEVNPLCVLDFYVHEGRQRSGNGLRLFNFMLEREHVKPQCLAYDRPSTKFICFLRKHFDLQNAINQMNKFVIFDLFFRDLSAVGYVPRNRRFVSSAPTDSRKQPTPDSRQISSASSSGRFHVGNISSMRLNNKQTILHANTLRNNTQANSVIGLPPKPPGKNGDVAWNRRNASNFSFGRNNTPPLQRTHSNNDVPEASNIYSRHSYRNSHRGDGTSDRSINPRQSPSSIHGMVLPKLTRNDSLQAHPLSNWNSSNGETGGNNLQSHEQSRNATSNNKSQLQTRGGQSYSVDGMYKQTVQHSNSYGTSWNLFGVPANLNNRTNGTFQRSRTGFFP